MASTPRVMILSSLLNVTIYLVCLNYAEISKMILLKQIDGMHIIRNCIIMLNICMLTVMFLNIDLYCILCFNVMLGQIWGVGVFLQI